MAALKIRPKVYWIWNHRLWCLENVPDGPPDEGTDVQGWKNAHWAKELFVVEKMLDSDARNCGSLKPDLSFFAPCVKDWSTSSCMELPQICFGIYAGEEVET